MMRFQRVRPDLLHLPNGKKPTSIGSNHPRTCKEDETGGCPLPRVRPGSSGSAPTNPVQSHFPPASDPTPSEHHQTSGNGNGRDMLLQWGHKKRSRGSRAEIRTAGDESTSSNSSKQMIKVQRRAAAIAGAEKIAAAAAAAAMPPPCGGSGGGGGGFGRAANLRPCMTLRDSSATNHNRTVEERSGGQPRPEKKNRSPPSPPDKAHKKPTATVRNGFGPTDTSSMSHHHHQPDSKASASDHRQESSGATGSGKATLEQFEWPRIYVSLSRKEKEDDFFAMKGTKLPQRPKKRAKNVDKALQYCFPGMWLSDLTRGRYEVREKKCVKKKARGLKGMESDSE